MMDDSDDSEEEDTDIKITGMFQGNKVSHDLFIKAGMEAKIESGLFKSAKSKYPMFPYVEEKIKFDDYGEYIRLFF
jgi:cleavage and polyadenylation specificity factor subunit 2